MFKLRKLCFSLFLFVFVNVLCCSPLNANAAPSVKSALVNVPVINMYSSANSKVDVVSQAVYNTQVAILQNKNGFSLIKTPDDYQGWVDKRALAFGTQNPNAMLAKTRNLFCNVYQDTNPLAHEPLFTVPFATEFQILDASNKDWVKVLLADNHVGYIQRGDVIFNPKPLTMQEMLEISKKFIGLPYYWGGTSSFGFDCSGYVQMLFNQMGVDYPRDTVIQIYWPGFTEVAKQNLRPGDVLFFGWDKKVSHTGIYLGDNKFINATAYQNPIIQISDIRDPHWKSIFIVARRFDPTKPPKFEGSIDPISAEEKQEMQKYSWHQGCPVPIENLASLKLSYWGFDNKPHTDGVLLVHKDVAQEVFDIFKELYEQKYPIKKIRPIDDYQGSDNASMVDNNTSAFNCRAMTDFANQYSVHSYGRAIDINPLINPYDNNGKVEPKEGTEYLDRKVYHRGKITQSSKIFDTFSGRGWVWGGLWVGGIHDYQHFEKPVETNKHR